MVTYCSDRYTENRDKQFCIKSKPSLEASGVPGAVLLHLHYYLLILIERRLRYMVHLSTREHISSV